MTSVHDKHSTHFKLARAAERLRLVGLEAEETGRTWLANLCWRKRVELLSRLNLMAAVDAHAQHAQHTGRGRAFDWRIF